jgi:hypothetical protein
LRTLSSMSLREEMWRRMAPESSAIGKPERRPPAAELFVDNPQATTVHRRILEHP